MSQPAPATAVPRPGRERNPSAVRRLESEEAQDVIEPRRPAGARAHVPALPRRGEEASRRLAEDLVEDALSALEGASSLVGIETVHLVRAVGERRDRPPASLTSMEVAVKEQLLGALADQPAVLGMRGQRPLAVPVGDHAQ